MGPGGGVDAPRQTRRFLVNARQQGRWKEILVQARDAQMMLDVAHRLLFVEGRQFERVTDMRAQAGEGLVPQFVLQFRLTHQDDAQRAILGRRLLHQSG